MQSQHNTKQKQDQIQGCILRLSLVLVSCPLLVPLLV